MASKISKSFDSTIRSDPKKGLCALILMKNAENWRNLTIFARSKLAKCMKRIVILSCIVFLAFVSKLSAQNEFHFKGTLSPLWSDAGNWQDGLKPDGDHAVVFLHADVNVDEDVVVDDLLYTDV